MTSLISIFLLVPWLLIPAHSQESQPEFVAPLPLFTEGLDTRRSANVIPDGALTEALNVTLDEDLAGVVVSRRGYAKYNASAITNTKSVRGLWSFDDDDGTKYFVSLSSAAFYKSVGDGSWSAITGLSGYSATAEFDCTQTLGFLWCLNGDTVFNWNGTSTSTVSGAPTGTLIDNFRNRVLIAGASGTRSRLSLSGELDGTDYTIPSAPVSTSPAVLSIGGVNDGNGITCLMGAYQDAFIIGKRNAIYALYGFDRRDFAVRELSREVGCIDDRSVQEKNGCLYWLSLRGIEKLCGPSMERVSDPIRDKLDIIISAAGNPRSVTDTTQSDFQAGNLTASGPGAPISATITPGSILPSSWSVTSNLHSHNFIFQTSNGDFKDGTTTNWTASGSWAVKTSASPTGGSCQGAGPGTSSAVAYPSCSSSSSRVFTIAMLDSGGSTLKSCTVTFSCSGVCVFSSSTCDWVPSPSASWSAAFMSNDGAYSNVSMKITDGTSGAYLISASSSNFQQMGIYGIDASDKCGGGQMTVGVTGCGVINYSTGGVYSTAYDTSITTPTWGPIDFSLVAGSTQSVTFKTRVADSIGGAFDSDVTQTLGEKITSAQKRVIEYFVSTASVSGKLAWGNGLDGVVSLSAATTGYFISQCRNPGTTISAWGIFQCNTEDNSGSVSFAISTGPTCHGVTRATATWTVQTNNTIPTVATSPFVAYRSLFDLDSATETPRLMDCTINWQEGATRPPLASSVYRDRYYLAYTSSTASGAANDHLLVLDSRDKWTLFNAHNCYSLGLYERSLYCGASTASGQVWKLDTGTDDDGAAILSRIRTKAFHLGSPERRKGYSRLYLDLEPAPDDSYNIDLTARYTLDRGTDTYSLQSVDLNEDPGHLLTPKFPFPLTNHISGRYIQLELESDSTNAPWRLFGGRLYYRPLSSE